MTCDSGVAVKHFFIYNSAYGQREGEEAQKILYYFPSKVILDVQVRNVGLSEAIIKFTETFKSGHQFESLHTLKTRQLYYQPEDGFWMVLVLSCPTVSKTKEGADCVEFQSDELQDNVYWAVLKQIYHMFRLFNGTFHEILGTGRDLTSLRYKLNNFLSDYLIKLKPQYCDVLEVFQGIQFLPLDKKTFLHVQTLINLLECSFTKIKYTAFLYNDQLVWSGLEPDDMQVVFRYVVGSLLPAHMETELHGSSVPRHSLHYGRFVFGASNTHDLNSGNLTKVYLNNDTKPELCNLLVYRALSATVCLFMDGLFPIDVEFLQQLDAFLGHRLTSLASTIAEQCNYSSGNGACSDSNAKFVYYNHLNRAQKSSVHLDNRRSGNVSVPVDVLRILADINSEFSNRRPMTAETIVKTMNDFWVVGKLSNLREFYVVIHEKNASLIEISEEVKKLCDNQFKSIFFSE